jgi:anti-sigma factor RsiW
MEPASLACRQYEAKLEDYLSGQLSGADAKQVTEHLKGCGTCSAALEDARASVQLLRVMDSTPDPGVAFARTAMARIRVEIAEEAKGFWQPFVTLAWRFAATATVALAVMVSYEAIQSRAQPAETTVASLQQAEVRDLFTTDADRVPANRDDVLVMVAETEDGK